MRAARAAGSTGTPSSLANIVRMRSSGRGRLPVCVVRNRSVLRFTGDRSRRGAGRHVEVARARRALPELGRGLSPGPGVGLGDGFDVGAEDRAPVAARPLVGGARRVARALEAWNHVASEQLVAPEQLLTAGPLVGPEEQAAEAAVAQLPQLVDAAHDRLDRTDE